MEYKTLLVDKKNSIATVTINREAELNSISKQTLIDLYDVCNEIDSDEDISCVVFTAKGDRVFSAGGKLEEELLLTKENAYEFSRFGKSVMDRIENITVPTICAVNGHCIGAGLDLLLVCDFAFAKANVKFAAPASDLGLLPAFGTTIRLPLLIGKMKAKELMYTGKRITSGIAKQYGLILEEVENDKLYERVYEFAKELVGRSKTAIKTIKKSVDYGSYDLKDKSMESLLFVEGVQSEYFKDYSKKFFERKNNK